MWAQEGSRYNFHFLKCLREHPGFLSPHQAGRWVRVSGLVTQLSPNKRSSQNPGERERATCYSWPLQQVIAHGKTGKIKHRAVLCFLFFLADLPTVWNLSENKLTLSSPAGELKLYFQKTQYTIHTKVPKWELDGASLRPAPLHNFLVCGIPTLVGLGTWRTRAEWGIFQLPGSAYWKDLRCGLWI